MRYQGRVSANGLLGVVDVPSSTVREGIARGRFGGGVPHWQWLLETTTVTFPSRALTVSDGHFSREVFSEGASQGSGGAVVPVAARLW